jgi:CheY-like chemotaxis protein
MDIQMPVMDGYQAACIIRDQLHITSPIIAMTAHAMAGEKEKCIEQGINDYLPKPFSESDLLTVISKWLPPTSSIKTEQTPLTAQLTDLSFLKKQTRNDLVSIQEMINMFINENPKDLSALEAAIINSDFHKIYKQVHALRNSTSLFGLSPEIGGTLVAMEKLAQAAFDIDTLKNNFDVVKQYCLLAVEELKVTRV